MKKVIIDGIEYVPVSSTTTITRKSMINKKFTDEELYNKIILFNTIRYIF
jgi:hypothetical protein